MTEGKVREMAEARTVLANFRVDPDLKRAASAVLAESGLTLSSGIVAFLSAVVRDDGLPFTPTARHMSPYWRRDGLTEVTLTLTEGDVEALEAFAQWKRCSKSEAVHLLLAEAGGGSKG